MTVAPEGEWGWGGRKACRYVIAIQRVLEGSGQNMVLGVRVAVHAPCIRDPVMG